MILVILSIKPKYCQAIIDGKKKYEFRKQIPKHWKNARFLIYASSPVQRIIGEFTSKEVINASPDEVWEKCERDAGITLQEFYSYFKDKDKAIALHIDDFTEYDPIDPWEAFNQFYPPQSYQYLTHNHLFTTSRIVNE